MMRLNVYFKNLVKCLFSYFLRKILQASSKRKYLMYKQEKKLNDLFKCDACKHNEGARPFRRAAVHLWKSLSSNIKN